MKYTKNNNTRKETKLREQLDIESKADLSLNNHKDDLGLNSHTTDNQQINKDRLKSIYVGHFDVY